MDGLQAQRSEIGRGGAKASQKRVRLSALPIIFDCDPGVDDAIMLLMALASEDAFDVLGVTTVSGNVNIAHTSENALKLLQLANRADIQVYSGCPNPIIRAPIHVYDVHGETGLGGSSLPPPLASASVDHAVAFLIQTLVAASAKITLSVSGPMTNIATALVMNPSIAKNIAEIVCMGGSQGKGNITPYAEFNFYVDPHAAHIVLSSGIPIRMIGLDVTTQVYTTEARLAVIEKINNSVSAQVCSMLRFGEQEYKNWGYPGRCVHDACITAALVRPELFTFIKRKVAVNHTTEECIGESAMTALDDDGLLDPANVVWVADTVDAEGVFVLMADLIARFS